MLTFFRGTDAGSSRYDDDILRGQIRGGDSTFKRASDRDAVIPFSRVDTSDSFGAIEAELAGLWHEIQALKAARRYQQPLDDQSILSEPASERATAQQSFALELMKLHQKEAAENVVDETPKDNGYCTTDATDFPALHDCKILQELSLIHI